MFILFSEILVSRGLHELIFSGSDTSISLPTGHGKSLIYLLAIPSMKELSKRSDELSFHVPSQPMLTVVSPLIVLKNYLKANPY